MAAYTLQHPNHPGLNTKEWDVSKFMGFSFDDTDVYKTIEGASYILQTYPDKKLKAYIDSVLDVVGAAQEPDGYLYTARTINPKHRLSEVFFQKFCKNSMSSLVVYGFSRSCKNPLLVFVMLGLLLFNRMAILLNLTSAFTR